MNKLHVTWMLSALAAALYATGALSDEPEAIPRTNVHSTVVGDATSDAPDSPTNAASLANDHHFQAGAPDLVSVTKQLRLSPKQQLLLNDTIQKSDAGAAALIRRENAVTVMMSSTNPEDPMYPKLDAEHSLAPSLWKDNRDSLRRDVLNILTPSQRLRFEQLLPEKN